MSTKRLRHHPPPSPESKEVQVCQKQTKTIAKVLQRKQPVLQTRPWQCTPGKASVGVDPSRSFFCPSHLPLCQLLTNLSQLQCLINLSNDVSCHLTPAAAQCTLVSTGSTDPLKKDPTQLRIAAIYSSLSCGLSVWLD